MSAWSESVSCTTILRGETELSNANWKNRTLFHGDNLEIMRGMDSETIDLIATDPPFNKGRDFHSTPDSLDAGAKFQDRWSWEKDVHQEWVDQITDDYPRLMEAIESARYAHSDGMGAFMCFMAVRLLEMKRILKSTGSIYLHCDPTASHYLKAVMDAIFGWRNFINEVLWLYKTGGMSKRWFGRKHDNILFYAKTKGYVFNSQKEKSYLSHEYGFSNVEILRDKQGVYTLVGMRDYWDIPALRGNQPEKEKYPTQKPIALYERIVKASSNPDDLVLDPFCGCATTCVAAERLGRKWTGIDIWEGAHEMVINRLQKEGLAGPQGNIGVLTFGDLYYETEPPERTDSEDEAVPVLPTINRRREPLQPWQRLSRQDIIDYLTEAQSLTEGLVTCAGCGREMEGPFMELDHMTPRADRGSNDISNRILLCRPCNGKKSDGLTMKGLLRRVKKDGWMQDEAKAKWARDAAQRCYEKLRYEG